MRCPDCGLPLIPLGVLADLKMYGTIGSAHWYQCSCRQQHWMSFTPNFARLWGRSVTLKRWPQGIA